MSADGMKRVKRTLLHTPLKRRGKIVFSLLAVLGFVGLVPLASVAWKLIDTNREALTTSQQEYQLLLASSIATEVDIHVEGLRGQLSRVARTLGVSLARPGARAGDEARRILADVADDRLLYLHYMDLKGSVIDTRSTATVPADFVTLFLPGLRKTAESILTHRADLLETAAISDPLLVAGEPPRAAIVVSAPVVSGGSFRGVLSALADLQSVWDSVVGGNRTGHTVFAVDSQGRLFATSDPVSLAPGRTSADSEMVRRFLSAPRRGRETMPFLIDRGGHKERYLGSYEVTREGWGIFVQAREREVYLPVRTMIKSTLSWALAALGLAVIAAVVFAGTLSNPIQRLAAAARTFAEGDFSSRVRVRSRNEIGELAEAFNRMASEIEDHIREIKQAAEENHELFLGTIRALAQTIDAKDPYTRGHSVRVNRYAVIIARHLGLSREEIQNIHVASLLHDVGKIGIDDSILKKPAPLTPEEYDVMKTHPALGAGIMAPIRQMREIIPGLRSHHERWRGGGYPDGLEGDAIPIMARIIAVADTFDAMTTDRPYQRAMGFDDAVSRLNRLKGVSLDEKVLEAFNRAYQAGEFRGQERAVAEEATV